MPHISDASSFRLKRSRRRFCLQVYSHTRSNPLFLPFFFFLKPTFRSQAEQERERRSVGNQKYMPKCSSYGAIESAVGVPYNQICCKTSTVLTHDFTSILTPEILIIREATVFLCGRCSPSLLVTHMSHYVLLGEWRLCVFLCRIAVVFICFVHLISFKHCTGTVRLFIL